MSGRDGRHAGALDASITVKAERRGIREVCYTFGRGGKTHADLGSAPRSGIYETAVHAGVAHASTRVFGP